MPIPLDILVTGGTGYIGQHLIPLLSARGHRVRVLSREQSLGRVPNGAKGVAGDALDADSVASAMQPNDTVIHLVGTPHPTPSKVDQFEKVDLISIRSTVTAARKVGIAHLIYVSVAQPAPTMQSYLWVRLLGETMIREAGLTASIVRPWYVLGPGHWWPKVIRPLYKLAELIPALHPTVERLGLLNIEQMVNAMAYATENPPAQGQRRIYDVPAIRRARL
ncbi:MAG TPA: NAD-dependent epimerase/dehydratase family protein [Candidatus Binatia bacterium]|nr:NAD-dependent epimerase/dehydratase family protein [Candidatus Binatia bacterium]